MAKKSSPNQALIDALNGPEKIKYDPALMEAMGENFRRTWDHLNHVRLAVYRDILPWLGPALADAIKRHDVEAEKQLHMRADREWVTAMGIPAITSIETLDVAMATAAAAGFPATDEGLRAWVHSRLRALEYSTADTPSRWAIRFNISLDTLHRRIAAGKIRVKKDSPKSYRIAVADLPPE